MYDDSTTIEPPRRHNMNISEELLNWYNDNSKDTLTFIWNENDEMEFVSKQVEETIFIEADELLNYKWTSLFPATKVEEIEEHFKKTTTRCTIQDISFLCDGDSVQDYFNGTIEQFIIRENTYFICQLKNKAFMKNLSQFISDTDKLVLSSQLSAGLVHEIRNPLTSLKGFLQLVKSGIEQKEAYYQVMINQIEKLEKITEDLLQMAKPDKANQKKVERVDVLIEEVLFLMETQTTMRNMEFQVEVKEDLEIFCNASQIKQVLLNLIKNGAEAMHHSGLLKVNASEEKEQIRIDITDEGEGISEEQIKELGNPFYTTKTSGTGLGLVITHHIMSMHNGELVVKSNENSGTTFSMVLPTFSCL